MAVKWQLTPFLVYLDGITAKSKNLGKLVAIEVYKVGHLIGYLLFKIILTFGFSLEITNSTVNATIICSNPKNPT